MKRVKITSGILSTIGIMMISIALVLQNDGKSTNVIYDSNLKEFDVKNMASSSSYALREGNDANTKSVVSSVSDLPLTEVIMETAPASVIIPPRIEVYQGMTMEELAAKLDRNLGSGYIAGKGYLIASHCIEKGVDPYVAVAIMLHETGCSYNCSKLVRTCNNVGGQKGAPGCNGGSYKAFSTLDEGIVNFIDNLYINYYSRGLNTIETIGPRYAASNTWISKIHSYVDKISAN